MAKFDVFLSHNSQDKSAVEQIARRLKSEYGLKVWLDKWNLIPGDPWQEGIEEALDQCQTYAVFLGPSGIGPWENEEMRVALEERVQDKKRRVIPVLLPGAPDNKTIKLPRFLKRLTWVDFRISLDDKTAFHYLICGIKGIPPGDVACLDEISAEGALPEPGDLPSGSRMPFTRNALFTGRADPLLALAKALIEERAGKSLVTQAVHGMGGIGKTQLAVEFCYRYGSFFHGVHWLNAAEPGGLKAEIATCGREMGLSFGDASLDEQVSQTLHAWKVDDPRLVVLDNFEDVQAARLWLPQLGHSALHLLVTARRSDWPADLGLRLLPLAIFTPEESRAFLRKYLPAEHASDPELDTLAARLGHLPLALELAGRYLKEHARMTVAEYIKELKQALAHPSMRAWKKSLGNPTGHDLDLLANFSVSWEQVKDKNARLVFMLCGYCAPNEPIPLELLEAASGLDKNVLDETLALLNGCGLLLPAPAMHPLLAEFARLAAQEKKGKEKTLEKIADALARLAKQANDQIDQTGHLDCFSPLRAHLLLVAEHAEATDLEVSASLLGNLGYYLRKIADYQGAKTACERALKINEQTYGPDHPNIALLINNLGSVLINLGDLAGAKAAFERALKIDEETYGSDHPVIATDINNLGSVLRDLGDLAGAKAAYQRALKIDEETYGSDHPVVATDINNLGSVLRDLGDLAGAKAAYQRALKIDEKTYGPDHPDVATDINNLGSVLQDLGDLTGAKAAYERALKIFENQLGAKHPNVATLVNNLGIVLQAQGDLAGAKAAFERALKIDEAIYGSDHPDVAIRVNNLGIALQALGDLVGAKAAVERALKIYKQFLPAGHPKIKIAEANLRSLENRPAAK